MFAYWLCDSQQLIYHFIDRQIPALITLRHASHKFKNRTSSSKRYLVDGLNSWEESNYVKRINYHLRLPGAPAWWTHKFKTVLRKLAHWQVSRSTPPYHSQHHPQKIGSRHMFVQSVIDRLESCCSVFFRFFPSILSLRWVTKLFSAQVVVWCVELSTNRLLGNTHVIESYVSRTERNVCRSPIQPATNKHSGTDTGDTSWWGFHFYSLSF